MNNLENEINNLNQQQKEAVDTLKGPVMVVAGPGTGKTQIIGLRTANILLKNSDIKPENILITTFTDAGVIAIKQRLEKFIGSNGYKVNVSTIHSFCQDVITTFPEKFLEYRTGTPIDEVDSIEILKKIIDDLVSKKVIIALTSDYDRFFYLRDIKFAISNIKQEGILLDEFKKLILEQEEIYKEELSNIKPTLKKYETTKEKQETHISKLNELVIIYQKYNEYLREYGKYDFNDMINFVLENFLKDNFLKQYYAEQFKYIMVDEFQDTNNAQNKIIDLILSAKENNETKNIMVVGDDDQSIYRFQGANIENLLSFKDKYEDTKIIVLENNYRSTQPILDLCTTLIDNNNERLSKRIAGLSKKLISSNPKIKDINTIPTITHFTTQEEEKSFLIKDIKEKIKIVPLNEIAIIVRNNKEVSDLSLFFEQNNIPVISKLNTNILENPYVLFILKFLNILNNPKANDESFIDILRSEVIGLNQIDIFKFNDYLYKLNYTKKFKVGFLDMFLDIEKISEDEVKFENKEKLIEFRSFYIELSQKIKDLTFIEFFNYFIFETKILDFIEKEKGFDDIEDIYTFFNKVKDFIKNDNKFNIEKLLNKVELYKEYNYSIPRQILRKKKDGVNILTAHGSKGLEYDIVYIPGLYNGNWEDKRIVNKLKLPNKVEIDSIEEDRRLFFVACSRAKKELKLSTPLSIDNKIKLISSFLGEIENNINLVLTENNEETMKDMIKKSLQDNNGGLYKYNSSEFDYIKNFLENYKLSPTDLNVFLEDPLLFLNQVVFKYPFVQNEATIFGSVYHKTLELFLTRYKTNNKIDNSDYLVNTFKSLLDKEMLSYDSKEKLLIKGTQGLLGYYDYIKGNIKEPLFLEYNLRPKNIIFENIPLTGKIDKIELIEGNNIALTDYKTGSIKTMGTIKGIDRNGNKKDGEGKYFRQLMFYKLLCELDTELISKYKIGALTIDFVEGKDGIYKNIEVDYDNEEFEEFKNELIIAWGKISNIDFWKEILQK